METVQGDFLFGLPGDSLARRKLPPSPIVVFLAAEPAGSNQVWVILAREPVSDEAGLVGVVNRKRLEQAIANGEDAGELKEFAGMLDFPHAHADHPLHLALDRTGAANLDLLPVVSRANIHNLVGVVRLRDVRDAYGIERRESVL